MDYMHFQSILSLSLCGFYTAATLAVLSVRIVPALRTTLLPYGKTRSTVSAKTYPVLGRITCWAVPKHWFSHFYVLSSALCCLGMPFWSQLPPAHRVLPVLIAVHSIRRMAESVTAHPRSPSSIWIGHYLMGLAFYLAINLLPWTLYTTPSSTTLQILVYMLFSTASIIQTRIHSLLFHLRASNMSYSNPRSGFFAFIIAPHYFAEILIYFSFCLVYGFRHIPLNSALLWVVTNLCISAEQTDIWGQNTFKDWGSRWKVIPLVF